MSGGRLGVRDGGLLFTCQTLSGTLTTSEVSFAVAPDELRAISVGDANHVKALTRGAVGAAIGGSVGALVGMASAKCNHVLLVACRRDDFDAMVSFAVAREDGAVIIDALQAARRAAGAPAIPRVEQLTDLEALDMDARQLGVLEDIRGLLMEQGAVLAEHTELLRRISGSPAS